jgi:hypothetical protein
MRVCERYDDRRQDRFKEISRHNVTQTGGILLEA